MELKNEKRSYMCNEVDSFDKLRNLVHGHSSYGISIRKIVRRV